MSREARLIFIAVYTLAGLGVVMTYSASAVLAEYVYHNPQYFLFRQILYVFLGTIVMFATASVPLEFWKRRGREAILLAIVFLMMVFIPVIGRSAGGARRWIHIGIFNFQPAEFAKVAVCLYLADYLARKRKFIKRGSLRIFLPPLFLIGLVCGLALLQPDLGSCAFIFLIVAVLFFLAGIRLRYILAAYLVFLPVFYSLVIRVPYRLGRVAAFLNPWEDPQKSGFQIIQSFLAFGLGGLKGVGLGQGTQKLFYLPSAYNDFIFSIIGEELGLLGVFFVIFLYAVIFVCGILIAERTHREYEKFLVISLTLMIVLQALIHMLVTTGLIPTKGLSLPFVSFGGTSLVFNLMAVGLLMAADRQFKRG